jgi:hypothetical protein
VQLRSAFRARQRPPHTPPALRGCYVFTSYRGDLRPGEVLYVGKSVNLRVRLLTYMRPLEDPSPALVRAVFSHPGKLYLYSFRRKHGDDSLFVRWTVIGAESTLEASLIDQLQPIYNEREESGALNDDEGFEEVDLIVPGV